MRKYPPTNVSPGVSVLMISGGTISVAEGALDGQLLANGSTDTQPRVYDDPWWEKQEAVIAALSAENASLRQQVLMLRTYPPLVLKGNLRFQWDADNGVWINITPPAATADTPIHRALRAHSHQTIGVRLP